MKQRVRRSRGLSIGKTVVFTQSTGTLQRRSLRDSGGMNAGLGLGLKFSVPFGVMQRRLNLGREAGLKVMAHFEAPLAPGANY